MEATKIFGSKNKFAIEIGATKKDKYYLLRFWVRDKKIGLFKKSGKLDDSLRGYEKFLAIKETLYLEEIDTMPTEDIPFYLFGYDKTTFEKNISVKETQERSSHYLGLSMFGDQFLFSSESCLLLYKNEEVIFIFCKKGILNAVKYTVSLKERAAVFMEYKAYCAANNLSYL